MQQRLPKFQARPEAVANHAITARDLEILYTIAHYRVISTSLLQRLIPGSPQGTANRLRILFHKKLIQRVRGRINEQCLYYIDNLEALRLLQDRAVISSDAPEWNDVRNQQKQNKPPSPLTLNHELMISRFHAMLQLACRQSAGQIEIASWRQGPDLWDSMNLPGEAKPFPHRPDAFFTLRFVASPEEAQPMTFLYEADRDNTDSTKFAKRLKAYFHYIVVQKKHREHYGVPRIRAVLIETLDKQSAGRLWQCAKDPYVSGKPSPLFWITASEFLREPKDLFEPRWATPVDQTLHALLELTVSAPAPAIPLSPPETLEDLEILEP